LVLHLIATSRFLQPASKTFDVVVTPNRFTMEPCLHIPASTVIGRQARSERPTTFQHNN
jgi:hypothetical protein